MGRLPWDVRAVPIAPAPQQARRRVVPIESGCRHHPDCFTCPLPECAYGITAEAEAKREQKRMEQLRQEMRESVEADG